MNAEIVARLESSFAAEISEDDELPDAALLKKASCSAVENMKRLIWKEIVREVIAASSRGLNHAYMSIDQVPGANGEHRQHQEIFLELKSQLEKKGYSVEIHDVNEFEVRWS